MPHQMDKRLLIMEWYDAYSHLLVKYLAKMLNDPYQAEDLMQDTFVKAYQYVLHEEIKYPKTFLFRIAHHLAIDHLRKQSPIQMIKDFIVKDNRPSIETILEIKEESKDLYDAILSLKPSYREVIILRKIEEFSIKETAMILNWSESKVKSTLFRATRALEKKLVKGGYINETT